MRRFFLATFLMIYIPTEVFASVGITALLPNPAWDDTSWEYIEIRNLWCDGVDISNYTLSDASSKSYIFPSGTMIPSHENLRLPYSTTKIALNNSWDESIVLKDALWATLDEYHYMGTQKDDVILSIDHVDDNCTQPDIVMTGTLDESISGTSILTGTVIENSSGTFIDSSSWSFTETIWVTASWADMTETGGLIESPDNISSWSVMSTGSIVLTGWVYTETGILTPSYMYYSDTDINGKIDTLEVLYPYHLTGSVYIDTIFLYSRTGGISHTKIDTATGYIIDGYVSGSMLILKLREWDIEKSILSINNSTSSDLRLKSLWDMGFRSVGWQMSEDFLLTKSFDSYKNASQKLDTSQGTLPAENMTSNTPDAWNTVSSGSYILPFSFPDILPSLQSPTNATFSWEIFTCTSAECRINIALDTMFSSGYQMRDYICLFGTGESIYPDADCNPNTIYFTSSGTLIIELAEKNNPLNSVRKIYRVIFDISRAFPWKTASLSTPDMIRPVAVLEIDGKWKEYYEQVDMYEMNCYTYTCSLNFTAENSYDPGGGKIRFFWIYGANSVWWSEDPGTRKYALWDHQLILRVIDMAGNYDEIAYTIHVLGPRLKEEKVKVSKKEKWDKMSIASAIIKKKKPKKIRMRFFSPPVLDIQWNNTTETSSGRLQCLYKAKKICNLNLSLIDTQKWYTYVWYIDDVEIYRGKNPKVWPLEPGKHTLHIYTYMSGAREPIDEQIYTLDIEPAPKKPKKSKKKSTSTQKKTSKTLDIIPNANANDIDSTDDTSKQVGSIAMMIFSAGIGMGYVLRRRKTMT